jgi:hypothetical protein
MTKDQRRDHDDNSKRIAENPALGSNGNSSKDFVTNFEALYHRRSGVEIAADGDRLAATAKRFRQEQMLIRKRQQRRQMLFVALLAVLTSLVVKMWYWS